MNWDGHEDEFSQSVTAVVQHTKFVEDTIEKRDYFFGLDQKISHVENWFIRNLRDKLLIDMNENDVNVGGSSGG